MFKWFARIKQEKGYQEMRLDQLKLLNDLSSINPPIPEVDPKKLDYVHVFEYGNKISFETKEPSRIKDIPLNSIQYNGEDRYGYHKYEVKFDEYHEVYGKIDDFKETPLKRFLTGEFLNFYRKILNDDQGKYNSCLDKHESYLRTVYGTIEDAFDLLGYVDKGVQDRCLEILGAFINDCKRIALRETESRQLDEKAINQSLKDRLDFEIEVLSIGKKESKEELEDFFQQYLKNKEKEMNSFS